MKRAGVFVGVIIVALLSVSVAAQVRAEVALRAAVEQETVKGDLKGAIEAYKKIVDGYRDNRPVRAQALLRMAECYQKLGDAQATAVYERIVRDFADQPQAAIAKSKVSPPARSGGQFAIRRVATGLDLWPDDISPDGDRIVFTDWTTGNLSIRDVAGDRVFRVTSQPVPAGGMFTEFGLLPVFSRDGSQVAYTWCVIAANDCKMTLRVSRASDTEPAGTRVVHSEGLWITAYDWSPDAKQIAAIKAIAEDSPSEIVLINVADGSVRTLRTLERGDQPERMSFSRDGRYLAFDAVVAAAGGDRGRREVFVLPVVGGPERAVAADAVYRTLVGWSSDGQRLLFTTNHRGTVDMYSIPMVAGQARGPAVLVKSDMGDGRPLRVAPSGRLFYATETGGGTRVKHATFDFSSGALSVPAALDEGIPGTNTGPQWSPDGQSLAYIHRRQITPQSRTSVMVRENASGETRELLVDLIRLDQLRWSADGRALYTIGTPARGSAGLYSIDVRSGGTTRLAVGDVLRHLRLNSAGTVARFVRSASGRHQFIEFDLRTNAERELFAFEAAGSPAAPQLSADGKTVFYRRASVGASGAAADVLVQRDLSSGAERELLRGRIPSILLSPDGKHVGMRRVDPAGKWVAVSIVPTAGEPVVRDLMRVEHLSGANLLAWSPDGTAAFINKPRTDPSNVDETWWVPLNGGAPRKLDQFMGSLQVHPDGRRITFQVPNGQPALSDIWVMEDFLGRSGAPPVRRRR